MSPKQPRPKCLPGFTPELQTACGKIYITCNYDPQTKKIIEVFVRFGKSGGCGSAVMDGMARMISCGLRSGMDADQIIKSLSGIKCHHGSGTCMTALAKAVNAVMKGLEAGTDPNGYLEEI